MRSRGIVAVLLACALIVLAGCAAGPNALKGEADSEGNVAGFWQGLWHGIIAPITFIISLFSKDVGIYEVHNNGGWYNFGFMFGASMVLGGGLTRLSLNSGAGGRWRWRKFEGLGPSP